MEVGDGVHMRPRGRLVAAAVASSLAWKYDTESTSWGAPSSPGSASAAGTEGASAVTAIAVMSESLAFMVFPPVLGDRRCDRVVRGSSACQRVEVASGKALAKLRVGSAQEGAAQVDG